MPTVTVTASPSSFKPQALNWKGKQPVAAVTGSAGQKRSMLICGWQIGFNRGVSNFNTWMVPKRLLYEVYPTPKQRKKTNEGKRSHMKLYNLPGSRPRVRRYRTCRRSQKGKKGERSYSSHSEASISHCLASVKPLDLS